ncbi:MAG: Uncharacterised protein [Cryomorphaceae bacterium]|nr:MAG: Uncharacterised protein [Cryomorphaceae bacterium]
MRNCAWKEVSKMSGARPAIVVTVVRKMARNRLIPALKIASYTFSPLFTLMLYLLTSTKLSFTIIPMSATTPRKLRIDIGMPCNQCPQATPVKLSGISSIITMVCTNERKVKVMVNIIRKRISGITVCELSWVFWLSFCWPS